MITSSGLQPETYHKGYSSHREDGIMLANRYQSHLLVIDVQQRLVPAIADVEQIVTNVARLVRYATILGVPITFTEHMPQRIGHLLPALRAGAAQSCSVIEKTTFSAVREPAFAARMTDLQQTGRNTVVVCGMEAHVCVMQTVLELRKGGDQVLLVADAVGSRTSSNRALAVDRMSEAGAEIVSQEMIAFEWLERGDAPEFKEILKLLK